MCARDRETGDGRVRICRKTGKYRDRTSQRTEQSNVDGSCRQLVMRGQKRVEDARERAYDPRIHLLRGKLLRRRMDCRVKPGNDSSVAICSVCAPPLEAQPTSVQNGRRGNFIVPGLLFTMSFATSTCRAPCTHVSPSAVIMCFGFEAPCQLARPI